MRPHDGSEKSAAGTTSKELRDDLGTSPDRLRLEVRRDIPGTRNVRPVLDDDIPAHAAHSPWRRTRRLRQCLRMHPNPNARSLRSSVDPDGPVPDRHVSLAADVLGPRELRVVRVRSLPGPPLSWKCPLLVGSGKSVTPWARMHLEKASSACCCCACCAGVGGAPLGESFWQAFCAAWKTGEVGSISTRLLRARTHGRAGDFGGRTTPSRQTGREGLVRHM